MRHALQEELMALGLVLTWEVTEREASRMTSGLLA